MRIAAIRPGDVVLVNKRGRVFYAKVRGRAPAGGLALEPLDKRTGWHSAGAREIVDHWSHARPGRGEEPGDDQLSLDDLMP